MGSTLVNSVPVSARSDEDRGRIEACLHEILDGEAFRTSRRSAQFLRYIVERTLAGELDVLKERMIGMALFNRVATYDTGEDAIVRVTASDVRRRLALHARSGAATSVRISLPLGTYVPEFELDPLEVQQPAQAVVATDADAAEVNRTEPAELPSAHHAPAVGRWLMGIAATFVAGAAAMFFAAPYLHKASPAALQVEPWSVLLGSPQPIRVILADPHVEVIEAMTQTPVSPSDYANHHLIPAGFHPTAEQQELLSTTLGGDGADVVDSGIAASFAALASKNGRSVNVVGARGIQLADLRSDDNFVLLGSPLSNPWAGLFTDQLDFAFAFNPTTRSEDILNRHPKAGERPIYHPTLSGKEKGFGQRDPNLTGEAFALIAFLRNPDHGGHVLLLAGTNREGTYAAGRMAASPEQLRPILNRCGLDRSRPDPGFEILLTLQTMAGTSSHVNAVACHPLS